MFPFVLFLTFFSTQPSSILSNRFAEINTFCSNQLQPVSLELVKRTNELAVINAIYADSGYKSTLSVLIESLYAVCPACTVHVYYQVYVL